MAQVESEASLIVKELSDGRISLNVVGEEDNFSYKICKTLETRIAEDEPFRDQISSYIASDHEITEVQGKVYRVKEFPILHYFLVTLFHREQLAIRLKYKELFRRIGEYEVKRFCDCDCYWCGSIVLKRDITLEKSEFIAFDYPDFVTHLTFDPDGIIDMENMGGLPYQFPFYLEVRDVMDGRVITYDKEHAKIVVDKFFKNKPFLHKIGDVFSTLDYQVVGSGDQNIVLWKEII